MKPRTYQILALAAIKESHRLYRSALIILATGLGKTVIFSHAAHGAADTGRVLVVAHRTELIDQAASKILRVTGEQPEIEKASSRAIAESWSPMASRFIVASVQTLTSGPKEKRRMTRFDPKDFSLVIIDEAHRAAAPSYVEVLAHFGQNPQCKFLGVTATGDRADGQGLGVAFESVAFTMELPDGVREGWSDPVKMISVAVDGLDYSRCRTSGGDLNEEDVAAAMAFESVLHPIAHATIELAGGLNQGVLKSIKDATDRDAHLATLINGRALKQTLVFAPSVALADRLAEIFCRWLPGSSRAVNGETYAEERKAIIEGFRDRAFPILVNVGVCTEGFDAPATEIIVMARPTKSRILATQMIGRGTRPAESIAGMLGELPDAAARIAAIAASEKPWCIVLDFVGNTGKHKLVSAVDVLAGDECDPLILDRATEIVHAGEAEDVTEALAIASVEAEAAREAARREAERASEIAEQEEAVRQASAAKRAGIVAVTDYATRDVGGVTAAGHETHTAAYDRATVKTAIGGATDPQINLLMGLGVRRETAQGYSKRQASAVIQSMKSKRCTDRQRSRLKRDGYTDEQINGMNFDAASEAIDSSKNTAA